MLYESPGGNQVDGLPPVPSTRAVLASWTENGKGRKDKIDPQKVTLLKI